MARISPFFSIITVCKNSSKTIKTTFDSVLNQSLNDTHYIVVDGKSSDDTIEIIKEYAPKFVSKGIVFEWKSEEDKGIYDAMNKGLAVANGDVIGILNSDDYYEPGCFQVIADAVKENQHSGIFYGYLRVLMKDGKELQTYRYCYENYLLNQRSGIWSGSQHPTCFVRKSVYEQIGCFDVSIPIAADYDFLLRAMKSGVRFHGLNAVLANFRKGGASDKIDDFERLHQRFLVLTKNGLLTVEESVRLQRALRYQKFKRLKRKIVRSIFGI